MKEIGSLLVQNFMFSLRMQLLKPGDCITLKLIQSKVAEVGKLKETITKFFAWPNMLKCESLLFELN